MALALFTNENFKRYPNIEMIRSGDNGDHNLR